MTKASISTLPPLKQEVLEKFLPLVGLYVLVGVFLLGAVYFASGIPSKVIHINYDSISAASEMSEAWNALRHPEDYPEKPASAWVDQFEAAVRFEEHNITEPGEDQIAWNIRSLWDRCKSRPNRVPYADYLRMRNELSSLVWVNVSGMFGLAANSERLGRRVMLASILIFVLSLLLALLSATRLAARIAQPLNQFTEILNQKPNPGAPLALPRPTTLEMHVLKEKMAELWERLGFLQKLNLEEISNQRHRLETVLASIEDAILVLDHRSQVLHANTGLLRILELPAERVVAESWKDLPSASENYPILTERLVPELTQESTLELFVAGKKRTFSLRKRNVSESDQARGTLYLLHDITDEKNRERLKSEFLGVLSHELKTPLQSLGLASELLLEKKADLDLEGKILVDTVFFDTGRIRAVANEFIQVGLVNLRALTVKRERITIDSLFPSLIKPYQVLSLEKRIQIKFQKEGSASLEVNIDTTKFTWAISNLLSNSVRVSPPDGEIVIRLSQREGKAQIEIQDEGPGIPASDRRRMFEPYFQGRDDPASSRLHGFLGLGLTIAKEVVEAHDGTIDYVAGEPRGSIFRILLPLEREIV